MVLTSRRSKLGCGKASSFTHLSPIPFFDTYSSRSFIVPSGTEAQYGPADWFPIEDHVERASIDEECEPDEKLTESLWMAPRALPSDTARKHKSHVHNVS